MLTGSNVLVGVFQSRSVVGIFSMVAHTVTSIVLVNSFVGVRNESKAFEAGVVVEVKYMSSVFFIFWLTGRRQSSSDDSTGFSNFRFCAWGRASFWR